MKRMLKNQITPVRHRPASSSDTDSILAYHEITERRKKSNWKAGTPSATQEVIRRDLMDMLEAQAAAATPENKIAR